LGNRKRRIGYRLRVRQWPPQERPMFTASNIHYKLSNRVAGLGPGGIGAMHLLAWRTGLIDAIDARLHLLKVHKPYHESDHVLNIAYNLLAGGVAERRGVPRRLGRPADPGPDDGGRFLPAVRGVRR